MDYNEIVANVSSIDCDFSLVKEINEVVMKQINKIEVDGIPQPLYNDKIASIDTYIKIE